MSLAAPNRGAGGGLIGISSIAWNPDNATQILTASEDDGFPVIFSWDLRNAHAPEKVLKGGNTKGILSIAWCPKDSELLLSCGKDCKTVCWNPSSGTVISEAVTQSNNWIFDVQWCPKAPDMFCTASFDGSVQVYSYQALASGVGAGGILMGQGLASTNDPFGLNPQRQNQQPTLNQQQSQDQRAKQIPKWLRRPIGATFAFGGRLIVFSSKSSSAASAPVTVSIVTIVTKASAPIVEGAVALDEAMKSGQFGEFCLAKIRRPIKGLLDADREAVFWSVLRVLVESNPQERLLNLLGFDGSASPPQHHTAEPLHSSPQSINHPDQLTDRFKTIGIDSKSNKKSISMTPPPGLGRDSFLAPPQPPLSASTEPTKSSADAIEFFERYSPGGTTLLDSGLFGVMPAIPGGSFPTSPLSGNNQGFEESADGREPKEQRKRSFSLFPKPEDIAVSNDPKKFQLERQITQSIILGQYQSAVDACFANNRIVDAFLIAACGGPELVAATQQRYFEQSSQTPYLRIVAGIIKGDLEDVVENADIENWTEIFGLICFHDRNTISFYRHCHTLGERMLQASVIHGREDFVFGGLLCLAASGDSASAIRVLLQMEKSPSKQNYYVYADWLQRIVEKIRVLERLCKSDIWSADTQIPEVSLYSIYMEYAYVLTNQGFLQVAGRYYNSVSPSLTNDLYRGSKAGLVFANWRDRLATALRGLGGGSVQIDPSIRAPFENTFPPIQREGSTPNQPAVQQPSAQRQPSSRGGLPPSSPAPYLPHPPQDMRAFSPGGGVIMPPPPPPIVANNNQLPSMPPLQQFSHAPSAPQPTAPSFPPTAAMPMPALPSQFGAIPAPPLPSLHQPYTQQQTPYYSTPTPPSGPSNLPPPATMPGFPPAPSNLQSFAPNPPMPVMTPPPPPVPMPQHQTTQYQSFPPPPPPPKPQTPPAIVSGANPPIFPTGSSNAAPSVPMSIPPPPTPSFMENKSQGSMPTITNSFSAGPLPNYNDPPMVPPKAPSGLSFPLTGVTQYGAQQVPQAGSPALLASTASRPSITSPIAVAPVDPAAIPNNLQPIYQTLSNLIALCQSRAMPMQKRIVDDSTKRIQHLFHQLARQELSPPVIDQVHSMCNGKSLNSRTTAYLLFSHFTAQL